VSEVLEIEDFNWDDTAVVVKPVQAIAVYKNQFGHTVIRLEKANFQDDVHMSLSLTVSFEL